MSKQGLHLEGWTDLICNALAERKITVEFLATEHELATAELLFNRGGKSATENNADEECIDNVFIPMHEFEDVFDIFFPILQQFYLSQKVDGDNLLDRVFVLSGSV